MKRFTKNEFSKIWSSEPLIVCDTNSILSLYEYAPTTSERYLKILNDISTQQIFIPHQVYTEYQGKYQRVRGREEKNKIKNVYDDIIRIIHDALNDFEKISFNYKNQAYPSINKLDQDVRNAFEQVTQIGKDYTRENEEEINRNKQFLSNNEIELFVEKIKNSGCIGRPFSFSEKLSIYEEGKMRYEHQIPPGFGDENKDKKDTTKREKYGDLLVWKQLLQHGENVSKDIIFITSDKKEWTGTKENKKEPSPLLYEEFSEYSSYQLYFMELDELLNYVDILNNEEEIGSAILLIEEEILEFVTNFMGQQYLLEGDDSKLTGYLVHSGEISGYLSNELVDVEITEFWDQDIEVESVNVDERKVTINGIIRSGITITAEEYTSIFSVARLDIQGNFSLEFEISESGEDLLDDISEGFDESWLNTGAIKNQSGGFDIISFEEIYDEEDDPYIFERCRDCGARDDTYRTTDNEPVCHKCMKMYDPCPQCGNLEKEMLGPFCDSCNRL